MTETNCSRLTALELRTEDDVIYHPEFIREYTRRFFEVSTNDLNPAKFYRYRSCGASFFDEELERLIAAHEIYFPSQVQLNDPFDCLPVCEKGVTFEVFRRHIHPVVCAIRTEMAREISPTTFSPAEVAELVRGNTSADPLAEVKELYTVKLDKMIAGMFATIGILSLTTCRDNLVMWSMYGDRGNGICIELDNLAFEVDDHVIAPVQVRYESSRPLLDYFGAAALFLLMTKKATQYVNRESLAHMLDGLDQIRYAWTKHERWRYEEEYRVIAYKSGGRYLNLAPARVSALYLGNKVAGASRERILSIVKTQNVPIYTGRISNRAYAMEFERLA